MPSPDSAEIIKTRSNCLSAERSAAEAQELGLRHKVDLVENGDDRPFHLGQMREEGFERPIEAALQRR